jgi:hypothetical protein
VDVEIHIFLTSAQAVGEWSASRPLPLYSQYSFDRRLSGSQSLSGWYGEVNILDPTEIRTLTPWWSSLWEVSIPTALLWLFWYPFKITSGKNLWCLLSLICIGYALYYGKGASPLSSWPSMFEDSYNPSLHIVMFCSERVNDWNVHFVYCGFLSAPWLLQCSMLLFSFVFWRYRQHSNAVWTYRPLPKGTSS